LNNKFDDFLNQAKDEFNNIQTPDMWENIENAIAPPIKVKHNWLYNIEEFLFTFRFQLSTVTVCLCIVIVGLLVNTNNMKMISMAEAGKFASEIDKDVFKAQKIYENAIDKMAMNFASMDLKENSELVRLQLDKLQTLDELIVECKHYLEENPYYPEIHKQLFYAYQEKIKIYKFLESQTERSIS